MSYNLYDVVKTASKITDSMIVGVSGGKDSIVTLDLCMKHFKNVRPYFMYIVPGLEFQESTLQYYENKYNTEFIRIPHFMTSEFLRYGSFRGFDYSVPIVKVVESYNYLRELTGVYWISAGERISDSIIRRAMIKQSSPIDEKRGRVYPIADWTKADVMSYLKMHKLPLSRENSALGFSFRSLTPLEIYAIFNKFPNDYEKIKKYYPLIDASLFKGELEWRKQHNDKE